MDNLIANGKAKTTKRTFSRSTGISIDIKSDPSVVWALLTNASDYTRWNSTVTSLEGIIGLGEKIQLKSYLDAKRVFKLTVKTFEPEKKLVWGDAMGSRVFNLKAIGNGQTNFTMVEKIGGPLFPLFAKMIPPFDEAFEKFANDLKNEAEAISNTK